MAAKKNPLIVFCGMDGTGKTTLAEKLAQSLKEHGLTVRLMHGHGYSVSQNSFGISDRGVKKWRYILRLMLPLAFLDNLFTFYSKYRPSGKKEALICDRYFYDKAARMLYYGICSKAMINKYVKLLPRPDYVFFLDVSPQSARSRKKEYAEEEFSRFRKAYKFIAECLKAPIIDTNLPFETCFHQVLSYFK